MTSEWLSVVEEKRMFRRLFFLFLGIILIFIPYDIYGIVGYSNKFVIGIEFLLALTGFFFIMLSTLSGHFLSFFYSFSLLRAEKYKFLHSKSFLGKLSLFLLGISLLSFPYYVSRSISISFNIFLPVDIIFLIFGFFNIFLSLIAKISAGIPNKIFILIIVITLSLVSGLFFIFAFSTKASYTDEFAIEILAFKRTLLGLNPYGYHFQLSKILSYGVPISNLTPNLSGGYITSIQYPALSFLILAPFVIFHLDPEFLLILSTIILLFVIGIEFIRKDFAYLAPVAMILALANVNVVLFSLEGITGIIWVSLLSISLVFLHRRVIPGIFFGLALAVKQLPIFILPFIIIFIYKKYGIRRALEFVFLAGTVFLIINLPFLINDPIIFFKSIISPETTPIIGIGFGLSQLYISGFFPSVDRGFFTVLMISVWFLFILLYYVKFNTLKYSLTVIPVIVLLFNFRLLENYLMYWPLLTLVTMPYIFKPENEENIVVKTHETSENIKTSFTKAILKNQKRITHLLIPVLIVIIILAPAVVLFDNLAKDTQYIKIISITPGKSSSFGDINRLEINASSSPANSSVIFHFRILEDGYLTFPNGFFWNSTIVKSGTLTNNYNIYLYTNNSEYYLRNGYSYIVVMYNQFGETWYHLDL
jgi:uncharacterized membrane protein